MKKSKIVDILPSSISIPAADYRKLIELDNTILPLAKRKHDDPEHRMQCDLFKFAALNLHKYPELEYLYSIPNGGHRHPAVAAQMKASGTKPGVFDTALDIGRAGYHGFRMELKCGYKQLSDAQEKWLAWYGRQGYYAVIVRDDWKLAADEVLIYLGYIKHG